MTKLRYEAAGRSRCPRRLAKISCMRIGIDQPSSTM
ncbi:Uncharacterised protein [Mycobacteroides abscessus subsp. abscessus]|nr:Uncharacterised protein [Mycobacteroides abscessus subsp. abscessus]